MSAAAPVLTSKLLFRIYLKRKLDLKNPKTLNEKIMWLKLNTYKNNPLVTQCADKIRVRDYVMSAGLSHILVPLYHVWDDVQDIDWVTLPEQFVMKCNHGCGYNIICPDKTKLDIEQAKRKLCYWMKKDFWKVFAEIHYRGIPHRILCEQYLTEDTDKSLADYKVYCFNGQAQCILVCVQRRQFKAKFYFFDTNWELIRINPDSLAAEDGFSLPKPINLDKLIQYACVLAKPFPFVRVDFYIVDEKVYFSEMTFTPSAGLDTIRLMETDLLMGSMLKL